MKGASRLNNVPNTGQEVVSHKQDVRSAQRLRLTRFGIAGATYAVAILAAFLITQLGLGKMSEAQWLAFIGLCVLGNVVFLIMFYTDANLRFSDPSLTREQIIYSALWGLVPLYALADARPMVLMFNLAPFSFGMLSLTRRQYLGVAACVMGLYALVLGLEYFQGRQGFRMQYELFLFVLFGILLTWFAIFGGFVSKIRHRLRLRNAEIQEAHEKTLKEIAVREGAETALRESETRFHLFMKHLPGLAYIKDAEGRVLFANSGFAKYLGIDESVIVGKTNHEVFPADFADKITADDRRVLESGEMDEIEESYSGLIWSTFKFPILESGEARLLGGLTIDITDRKRAEEALLGSEEKHRTILENIEEGYYEVDLAGNMKFCNESLARMLDYARQELIGVNNRQYMDADAAREVYSAFNSVLTGERQAGTFVGWELMRKDGSKLSVEASVSLIRDSEGKPCGFRGIVTDVTERKKAEEERRRSQERYRHLIENASDVIFVSDANGYFTFVNSTGLRLSGYSEEEIVGRHYLDLILPEYREDAARFYGRQFVKGIPDTYYEYPFATKDGEARWFGQNAHMVMEGDTVKGFQCISRDITDRKQAEQALQRSEEMQRTILSTSPVGIGLATDRKMVWVNDAWNEMFGLGPNDGAELTIDARELYPTQEEFERVGKVLYEGLETGQANETEATMVRKDGTTFDAHFAIKAVDASDPSRGTISAIMDVTDRKRAEQALRKSEETMGRLIQFSPVGIGIVQDGKYVYCNPALATIMGAKASDEMVGESPLAFIVPEDRDLVRQRGKQRLEDLDPPANYQVGGLKKNGEPFDLSIRATRIDYLGRPALFAFVADVTLENRIKAQLLHAQKMEAIGTLTGGIAHDFNNLLTIINGYTEMVLSEKTEDDPSYLDLQKVLETGRKGAELVQRLLALTKKGEVNPQPLDLNSAVENTSKLLERTFPKMIEIEATLENDLGKVNADSAQVEQVLMNLCINAKEAMPEGGRLRLETRNTFVDEEYRRLHPGAKPGRNVLIEISDTGIGMSKELMDRMFDPFFTTKGWDFKKGTGLGLSVAKGIVEQHGGWMTCQSEPGKGTTFRLHFPIIEEPIADQKPEPLAEAVPGGEKILLVDDEELVRDLGKRILERAGYTVITAANGKEALEIYSREQSNIGLVVIDLIMPQMGGETCLEELLKINPYVKVIVSSGHSLDAREGLHLGALARGFVNKPYEVRQLVQTVERLLFGGHNT